MNDASDADVTRVAQRAKEELGPESEWPLPVMLPGLALCLLNAIYSTGNRSESVVRVLDRYRCLRWDAGVDPAGDGARALREHIQSCGGPEGFADTLGNHWRAWQSKTAPYKTEVINEAAGLLTAEGVDSLDDLITALGDPTTHARLKADWLGLPGQRSGLTWRYFLMNAGAPGVKADRMITRWTSRALKRRVSPVEAERVLTGAAHSVGVEARRLDHAVWASERQRRT